MIVGAELFQRQPQRPVLVPFEPDPVEQDIDGKPLLNKVKEKIKQIVARSRG